MDEVTRQAVICSWPRLAATPDRGRSGGGGATRTGAGTGLAADRRGAGLGDREGDAPSARLRAAAQVLPAHRAVPRADVGSSGEAADDLAEQLATSAADLQDGDWRGRSSQRHRQAILTFLGVRRLVSADRVRFAAWLTDELCPAATHCRPWSSRRMGGCGINVCCRRRPGPRAFGSRRPSSRRAGSVDADRDGVVTRGEGIDRPSARRSRCGDRLHQPEG